MYQNDIVYLKSGSPKLIIEWLVGITKGDTLMFDPNKVLMARPTYKPNDISVKWADGKHEKKETFPDLALTADAFQNISSSDQMLTIGCVVRHRLSGISMTVLWIVGMIKEPTATYDPNEVYKHGGIYSDGDIVCGWFDKNEFQTKLFRKEEVEKIFD